MDVGKRLKEIRKGLGLTQKQMVFGTNLTAKHYSKIENGDNNISVNDLIDVLTQRNIDLNLFFGVCKESEGLDNELNEAFYNWDLEKAIALRDEILNNPEASQEQRDRAILTVDVLKGKDHDLDPETKEKILNDFMMYDDWVNNIDALRLFSNIIRENNVKDFTPAVNRLIRQVEKDSKLDRHQLELIATIGINYLFNARKIGFKTELADRLVEWIKELPPTPNFLLYKMLGNYFTNLDTNETEIDAIIDVLNKAGYSAIVDRLPR